MGSREMHRKGCVLKERLLSVSFPLPRRDHIGESQRGREREKGERRDGEGRGEERGKEGREEEIEKDTQRERCRGKEGGGGGREGEKER